MELLQEQTQKLNQQQIQSVELLQLSTPELEEYLRELAQENPVVDLEDLHAAPEPAQEDELFRRLRWLEDNDRQNLYYQHLEREEADPMLWVGSDGGLEETLPRFLLSQISRMNLEEETARILRGLACCLDETGYLRTPLEELSAGSGVSVSRLSQCLALLQTLEPAGVGAENLSRCLELQLQRAGQQGPALAIVRHHLEDLGRHRYRTIALKLHISAEEVREAERIIRRLNPYPGAAFQRPGRVQYIQPDVFVREEDGRYVVHCSRSGHPPFQINSYYRSLLTQTEDPEVREYLRAKLRQAEEVLQALGRRDSTLLRCAQVIAERQTAFFREGPQRLTALRMADVARELNVHESTVSRAVREKYLQCARGVYPLSYFFSRGAAADAGTEMGGTAARALLRQLIDREDKRQPLSDQKLCEELARQGCAVSRRTVAKYRGEMSIPGASGRKQ